ncbi:hypothetical protein HanRHA438_Chr06g0285931 [Helianthus annuus]|nr:hypothetical protein HanRHA438_Chr06g0285931 [Helianthus annuus]
MTIVLTFCQTFETNISIYIFIIKAYRIPCYAVPCVHPMAHRRLLCNPLKDEAKELDSCNPNLKVFYACHSSTTHAHYEPDFLTEKRKPHPPDGDQILHEVAWGRVCNCQDRHCI